MKACFKNEWNDGHRRNTDVLGSTTIYQPQNIGGWYYTPFYAALSNTDMIQNTQKCQLFEKTKNILFHFCK